MQPAASWTLAPAHETLQGTLHLMASSVCNMPAIRFINGIQKAVVSQAMENLLLQSTSFLQSALPSRSKNLHVTITQDRKHLTEKPSCKAYKVLKCQAKFPESLVGSLIRLGN